MDNLLKSLQKLKRLSLLLEEKSKTNLIGIEKLTNELESLGGEILKLSKESINSSINDDSGPGKKFLTEAEKKINTFDKKLNKIRHRLGQSLQMFNLKLSELQRPYSSLDKLEKDFVCAKEEFFEAELLYNYLASGKNIFDFAEKLLDFESYAGAASDFCGELVRKAKLDIIKENDKESNIEKYYKEIQLVYQTLSNFSFSNKSGIRAKVENLKGYIKKMEDIRYDLKIKK
jgi:predicted translin family RNA/ssDNA-binding protein